MLRINLLPKQKRAKVSNVEKELVLFVLVLAMVGIGAYFTQSWIGSKVDRLQGIKQEKRAVKRQLQRKVARIGKIKDQIEETKEKIEIIKKIRAKQSLPIRYLNELVAQLPKDKIWFESLNLNSGGDLNLSGIALDNQAFASYIQHLRNSEYIRDINLKQTSRKNIKGLGLVSFQCRISTNDQTTSDKKHG
jgi:type IV pilus assembly protein PilN